MTIGGTTLDDTVSPDGIYHPAAPGGNAIYSAVGINVWSEGVGVVSVVGQDYPQAYLEALEDGGINISGIKRVAQNGLHLWILYENMGKHRQIIFQKDSGVFESEIDPAPDQIPEAYLGVKFAHLSACGFNSQQKLAAFFHQKNLPYAYDIAQASIPGNSDDWKTNQALHHCDLLLPSIEEIRMIWGDRPLIPLFEELSRFGPKVIAVKTGKAGSLVYDPGKQTLVKIPVYPVEVVDPTGAGDAYCGGFLAGYYETGDPVEAGLRGTISASFAIEDFGALHFLKVTKAEKEKRLNALRKQVERIE